MSTRKWTAADIGDQTGRLAIVTGANSGLGLETARELARSGASVVLAVRSLDRGKAAVDDIKTDQPDAQVQLQELDLASLDSIGTAAQSIRSQFDRVDLLINNAGVMYTPRSQTADGFEMQFGTNHLGHFAWTGSLIDLMQDVEGSRVVTISSVGHRIRSKIDFDDLNAEKSYNRVAAYGRSKLSNLLFTYELQRRLEAAQAKTIALASHPGVSDTELGRHLTGLQVAQPLVSRMVQGSDMGALPTLRAACDPNASGGEYYGPGGFMEMRGHPVVVKSSGRSHETSIQTQLWSASEQLTKVTYPI